MTCLDERPATIFQMLDNYRVDDLKKIQNFLHKVIGDSRLDYQKAPTRKAELIQWILKYLKDLSFLKLVYQRMDDLEKAALQETVHNDGILYRDRFQAKYGATPRTSMGGRYFNTSAEKDRPYKFPPLALFMTSSGMMPLDMRQLLMDFVSKPRKFKAQVIDSLPETLRFEARHNESDREVPLARHLTAVAATNDVMAILQLVDMGNIPVSAQTGKPTATAAKNIRKILSNGDFYPEDLEGKTFDVQMGAAGIRPFAWVLLLQAGGLAKVSGSKLSLTRIGKAALKKPASESLKRIWEQWLKNKNFHEMSRIEIIKGQRSKKRPLFAAASCRPNIASALSEIEEGAWITTEAFFDFLIAKGYDFELIRNDWALYIADSNYGSMGYSHITWQHLNGRYARAFLLEYAATLGLIDVALVPPWGALADHHDLWGADDCSCLSRYDGLHALRLNALGAWILEQKDTYTPTEQNAAVFKILPNLEIVSLAPVSLSSDQLFIERFCETKSERVWQINLPKLLQAVEEGIDFNSILTFLTQRCDGPLPQPVAAFFEDARNRVNMVRDAGEARLLKFADKAIALLISNDTRLNKLCMPAGKEHIVVYKETETRFRRELRNLGYVLNSTGSEPV